MAREKVAIISVWLHYSWISGQCERGIENVILVSLLSQTASCVTHSKFLHTTTCMTLYSLLALPDYQENKKTFC